MKPYSLIERAFFLKKVRLFAELDLDLILAIAEKMNVEPFDAQEKVFSLQQVANRMYIIAQGTVELIDAKNQLIGELTTADFFGDESIFNERPRSYTAQCKTAALLFTLSRTNLLTIISECPTVAVALLQCYSQRLEP